MEIWTRFDKPPLKALKTIQAGRLKGKSDINPVWRYKAMTDVFGPCGVGWRYEIDKLWNEPCANGEMFAFALISLYVKVDEQWSEAIPANGGAKMITEEARGLHYNDEGYKMAITDALSTAMNRLGVAAEIYMGNFDGSKYINQPDPVLSTRMGNHVAQENNPQETKVYAMHPQEAMDVPESTAHDAETPLDEAVAIADRKKALSQAMKGLSKADKLSFYDFVMGHKEENLPNLNDFYTNIKQYEQGWREAR